MMVNQASVEKATLQTIETPCLMLDADRMDRNVQRLKSCVKQGCHALWSVWGSRPRHISAGTSPVSP